MASRPRGEMFARVMGFIVFLGGVAVIVCVLWLALQLYNDPTLGGVAARQPKIAPDAVAVGTSFATLIVRIILLFLCSFCGSLIASKGIAMYFSALAEPRATPEG